MKKRYWLWERDGVFYLDDALTRKKESLHTRNRDEAERIRAARNEAVARPILGVALAKAYLSAHDSEVAKRTWQHVIDRYCASGKPQTQKDRRLVAGRQPQRQLLKISGVSLHSYRYAWAERAKSAGYPERFAQEALGHNSKAWARSYSKRAHVVLPPLEDYENKILPLRPNRDNPKPAKKIGVGV